VVGQRPALLVHSGDDLRVLRRHAAHDDPIELAEGRLRLLRGTRALRRPREIRRGPGKARASQSAKSGS
jgi:hypothetical protein